MPSFARVEAVPVGEAPDHIREQWKGVIVELAKDKPTEDPMFGVISGKQLENHKGYAVWFEDALKALIQAGKLEAALWWADWLTQRGYNRFWRVLSFQESEIKVLQAKERPKREGELSWSQTLLVYDKLIEPMFTKKAG